MATAVNQRDARKAATRRALSEAAIDLFTSQGFDETRVEDIAAAVGVTSRTFFLHFPTKEDAAFPDHADRVAGLAAVLDAATTERPDDDTLPLLRRIVVDGVRETSTGRVRAKRQRLFHRIEPLRAKDVLGDLDYEEVIVAHLVERGRTEFDSRRIAMAVMGTARAALTTWVHDPSFDPAAAAAAALEEIR